MEILIVDDNQQFCSTMEDIIKSFSYKTRVFNRTEDGINYIKNNGNEIGLALFDVEFANDDPMTGLDLLEFVRNNNPAIPVVMITGKGTISTAVRATKLGATNFIEKSSLNIERIKEVLETSIMLDYTGDDEDIRNFLIGNGIVAKSRVMLDMGRNIIRYGRTDLNLLITGDTGTGKKLVSRAAHNASRRSRHPLITVDIPNIPRDLFQSELFGHIKGAYSGATETKKGLFHEAAHGTLFLDEIGDLSLELQSNLFIPIDEKIIRKVGSVESEAIDIRFISATDRDLVKFMDDGKFREQLYHRLRECEINIPPLRERKEDIPDIVNYYAQIHNQEYGASKYFTQSALEYLTEQDWKGNVRELASVVKVALQTIPDDDIKIGGLDKIVNSNYKVQSNPNMRNAPNKTLKEDLAEVDKMKIEEVLKQTYGNVSKSAVLLGVSRETLHIKIRKYLIDVQKFRKK